MRSKSAVHLGLFILVFSFSSHSSPKNYPCSGAPGTYRTNPDSSAGGFVASTATIDASVFLDVEASICERATVIEGAKIMGRAEISGRTTVHGKVMVQDRARVYGEAYIINPKGTDLLVKDDAKIYGHAFLQGSVIVGDSSEIFGWGKVLDYAQVLGYSKICGSNFVRDFEVITDDQSKCIQ